MSTPVLAAVETVSAGPADPAPARTGHGRPRFLYADSAPFPGDFDCIASLDAFVRMAADVLDRVRDARVLQADLADANRRFRRQSSEVDAFTLNVADTARKMAGRSDTDCLPELAAELESSLQRRGAAARASLEAARDEECRRLQQQLGLVEQDAAAIIQRFLMTNDVQLDGRETVLQLSEGKYSARATHWLAGGARVAFDVDAAKLGWSAPRSLRDVCGDAQLKVELRRGWLRRNSRWSTLDGLIISRVHATDDSLEVRLRRKRGTGDHLTLLIERTDGQLHGHVSLHRKVEETSALPAGASEALQAVWDGLQGAVRARPVSRVSMAALSIGEADGLTAERCVELIDRLVQHVYGPFVGEASSRGTSTGELSLKRQLECGRREESYLLKNELSARIAELAPEDRPHLEALGLAGRDRSPRASTRKARTTRLRSVDTEHR